MMSSLTLMNDVVQVSAAVSDLEDIDRLVQTYRSKVLAFAFSWLRDMDLAETVTQECFMLAFGKGHLFRGECSESTWRLSAFLRTRVPCIRSGAMRPTGICNAVSDDSMPLRSCVRGSTPGRGFA